MDKAINKTIVVSYDEVSRMMDFCCEDGFVSKDFLDWYLIENTFFTKNGILIIENVFEDEKIKYCLGFDFNNPNVPQFNLYDYKTQKCVAKFRFSRDYNMTMKDVDIILKDYDYTYFSGLNYKKKSEVVDNTENKLVQKNKAVKNKTNNYSTNQLNKNKSDLSKELRKNYKELHAVQKDICKTICVTGVYSCYATMYYFVKNKPKEIIGKKKDLILQDGLENQVKAIYKYTGYINLSEHKVYKTTIEKPEGEETRVYGRHIEKWSVRGHYRMVNGNPIWIEAHERGEGNLEKRIYGTEKESEVNVLPKVFEVERNVMNKDIVREKSLDAPVDGVPKLTYIFDKHTENTKEIIDGKYKKINFFKQLFSFFKRIKNNFNKTK